MSPSTEAHSPRLWLVVAIAIILFRLWTSFCFFPVPEWNSVRLTPTFMLRYGASPYPGADTGPLTTWIYGPVPLLLNLPATLASDVVTATLLSGGTNLLVALVPLVIATRLYPLASRSRSFIDQAWLILLCLAIWPNTSLHYIQADNVALAFGLVSNALLARPSAHPTGTRVAAAFCLALAVWSKQTTIGLALAQLIWLGFVSGLRAARQYAAMQLSFLGLLGLAFVMWFGLDGIWLNVVAIPGHIPWCADFIERAQVLWKDIVLGIVAPLAGLWLFRDTVLQPRSPWLLPFLSWLCLLPMAFVSIFKAGGASNSLHGYLYLAIPVAAAVLEFVTRRAAYWAQASLVVGICALTELQLLASPYVPLTPVTRHLGEASYLAQVLPRQIYFPWHPLVTWYSDRRFYHAEDGLFTRGIAHIDRPSGQMKADFPREWCVTAIPGWREEGVFRNFQPAAAELNGFGKWSLFSWGPNRLIVPTSQAAPIRP